MVNELIATHSWWVSPKVYRAIKVVYPRTRRRHAKEKRGQVVDGIRLWYNEPAQRAFWMALGQPKPKNSVICHIYENSAGDPKHFTNLANMTALPTCLESLSEWPPVQSILKYHSYRIFRYKGPKGTTATKPRHYPRTWRNQKDPPNLAEIVKRLRRQRRNRSQG